MDDLVRGAVQPRHHLGRGEHQHLLDLGDVRAHSHSRLRGSEDIRAHPGRGGGLPAGGVHAGDERAGDRLEIIHIGARGAGALDMAQRGP